MNYFTWLIVGIILLAITILIHKQTYKRDRWGDIGDKLPTPRWACIIAIAIAITPALNVLAFLAGLIGYCMSLAVGCIMFHCEYRWYKSLIGWLTAEV